MPSHLKDLVRARMEKTGESYEQALRQVRATGAPSDAVVRARTVADTAFSVAAVRADEKELFSDPYAQLFASAGTHVAEATQRFLDMPFFRPGIRIRTRFLDDALRAALLDGFEQVVILGAGFDTRALRIPELRGRRVFEIDTAEQLARKRQVLTRANVSLPPNLTFVPCDFDHDDYDALIDAQGFRRGLATFFIWEGVIGYVDGNEIDRSLHFMAHAGSRNRVGLTYSDYALEPDTTAGFVKRAGFATFEEHGSDALWRRYLSGEPHENAWVVKLGIATT